MQAAFRARERGSVHRMHGTRGAHRAALEEKPMAPRMAPLTLSSLTVCCLLALGCGGAPVETKGPVAPVAPETSVAPSQKSADTSKPAESAVAISKDILKTCGISDDSAYFPFDSTAVIPASTKPLKDVAKCFSTGPLKGKSMAIIGHADPRGDGDYNFALGLKRADAVAGFLQGAGLPKNQVATTSRGAMDATGSDEPSWAKDRRVDIELAK
jgi:peptidoglycan-associated lipoprotein